VLWKFQTGFGADAPSAIYEVDGDEYIAIATGGNSIQRSANGDAVWAFSLKGRLGPAWWPPPPPPTYNGPGPLRRIWSVVSSLWQGQPPDKHLEERKEELVPADRGDR
jgi:hypothetical protein